MRECGITREKPFQGWKMVLLATLCVTFIGNFWSQSTTYSNAIMMNDPNNTVSRVVYGFSYTLATMVMGLGAHFGGALNTKYGPKKTFLIAAGIAMFAGFAASNFIHSDATYVFTYSILGALAYSLAANTTTQTICNNWFARKRGMANAIPNFGMVIAGLIAPQILSRLIAHFDNNWRVGHYFYGATALLGLVLALFIIRAPADIGQFPDGIDPVADSATQTRAADQKGGVRKSRIYMNNDPAKHWTYRQAIRSPFLWIVIIVDTIQNFASNFVTNPGMVIFTDAGWQAADLANVLSLRQLFNFVFILLFMYLTDRFEPSLILAGAGISTFLCFLLAANPTHMWQIYLFYIGGSINMTVGMTVPSLIYVNYFGTTNFGKIAGTSLAIGYLFGGLSSGISGIIKETLGSYNKGFYIWGGSALFYAVLSLILLALVQRKKAEEDMCR